MEGDIKIKRFSGKPEDYNPWKRAFIAQLTIKKLADFLLEVHPQLPNKKDQLAVVKHVSRDVKTYSYVLLSVDDRMADVIEVSGTFGDVRSACNKF